MHDVDFLPIAYRQQHARRFSSRRRAAMAACFALILAGAGLSQHLIRAQAAADLAQVLPLHANAQKLAAQLAQQQDQLQALRSVAELHTYLRHPWPRTQLLSALFAPLPESVTLGELRLGRENARSGEFGDRLARSDKPDDPQAAKLAPPVRDLKWLRDTFDKAPVAIQLAGWAGEQAALHRYLATLARNELFSKVQLESMERDGDGDRLRFLVRIQVRPGYGQPDGPTGLKPAAGTTAAAGAIPAAGGIRP